MYFPTFLREEGFDFRSVARGTDDGKLHSLATCYNLNGIHNVRTKTTHGVLVVRVMRGT